MRTNRKACRTLAAGSSGSKQPSSSSSLPGTSPSGRVRQLRFSVYLLLRFFACLSEEPKQLSSPLLSSIHSGPSPIAFSVRC